MPSPEAVRATLQYLGPCTGKPVFYGRQAALNNLPLAAHEVWVEDLRARARAPTLDVEGFQLLAHRSAVTDFLDSLELQQRYLPELEAAVRSVTGASVALAIPGGVMRRSERAPGFGTPGTTVVGRFVHCDYSLGPAGSSDWVRRLLPAEEAERRLRGRYAIYNLWRVLSDPPQDVPLALCDARSVATGDRLAADSVNDPPDAPEWRFELGVFRHSPSHRWGCFRDMTRDELLIFKGYESDPARAAGIPHAAFDDPACGGRGRPRESVDHRVLAFFDP